MDRRMVDWDDWKLVRTLQFPLVSFIGVCGVYLSVEFLVAIIHAH